MKKIFLLAVISILPSILQAYTLRDFLRSSAWGLAGGATAGVVSLALVDKPNESWNNVAKGASLGLYVGIGYGLYQMNQDSKVRTSVEPGFSWAPRFQDNEISGVDVSAVVFQF